MTRFYPAQELLNLCGATLEALGFAEEHRAEAAVAVWQASLRGVDSHGVRLLPHYVECVRRGRINTAPNYSMNWGSQTSGVLDADDGLGHMAATRAMRLAVERASETGAAFVAVKRSTHCGAMAYYAEMAANKGMIGLALTNATARVVPHNAGAPFFGTNPVCFAAPMRDEGPLTYDAATSLLPFNKVRLLAQLGRELPEGCATDGQGRPTRDPKQAVFLQHFGGYKGFGLGLLVEMCSALLTGMPYGPNVSPMFGPDLSTRRDVGHFFGAIAIEAFLPVADFAERLQAMAEDIRALPQSGEEPVMVPGDPEKRMAALRNAEGIPMSEQDAIQLDQMAKDLGLSCPNPFPRVGRSDHL